MKVTHMAGINGHFSFCSLCKCFIELFTTTEWDKVTCERCLKEKQRRAAKGRV